MSVEDFWWDTHNELNELGLKKQFDKQLNRMEDQDHHKHKDARDKWVYALEKVKRLNQ